MDNDKYTLYVTNNNEAHLVVYNHSLEVIWTGGALDPDGENLRLCIEALNRGGHTLDWSRGDHEGIDPTYMAAELYAMVGNGVTIVDDAR